MACIAQVCPTSKTVRCQANDCGFLDVDPLEIELRRVSCCIIRGVVECADGSGPVRNALVLAIDRDNPDNIFRGITNNLGEYCIVVPSGEPGSAAVYDVEAYCAENCTCELAGCRNCGCDLEPDA